MITSTSHETGICIQNIDSPGTQVLDREVPPKLIGQLKLLIRLW